jgi:hypothetical protein
MRKALPELNLENRDLEWARLRYWFDRTLEEFKEPPQGDPESPAYKGVVSVRASLDAMRAVDADLVQAGIPVPLAVLRGAKVPYPEAIPVLLKHLDRPYNSDIKDTILRSLAVPYAGEAAFHGIHRILLWETSEDDTLLFVYGIALEAVATKRQIPELLAIAAEPRLKGARFQVLIRLAKWRVPEAVQLARDCFDEPLGEWRAIRCLRLLRSWGDRAEVEKRLHSTNADVRAEAKAFLKSFNKACPR